MIATPVALTAQTTAVPTYPTATNATLRRIDSGLSAVQGVQSRGEPHEVLLDSARQRIGGLIRADSLRTFEDFIVASKIYGDSFFENERSQYECALVAFVQDPARTLPYLVPAWDFLGITLGRGQRIGSFYSDDHLIRVSATPAPASVRDALKDIVAARASASRATDNADVQGMYDADQADRRGDFDLAKLRAMHDNDVKRRAQLYAVIAQNGLRTARDFYNASLIMQHGEGYDDYALAHELAIVASALGSADAVWLLAATYDRMLLDSGHRQRFGTQGAAGRQGLGPQDTTGINRRMRLIFGSVDGRGFLVPRVPPA